MPTCRPSSRRCICSASFTGFAIERQIQAAGTDAVSAQQLYDGFAAFLAANKPDDLEARTQPPGVIGI